MCPDLNDVMYLNTCSRFYIYTTSTKRLGFQPTVMNDLQSFVHLPYSLLCISLPLRGGKTIFLCLRKTEIKN